MQIMLPWNISWEFFSIALQFIVLKLGSRDQNSGRENDLCRSCGIKQRLKSLGCVQCFISRAARTGLSWQRVVSCSPPPSGEVDLGGIYGAASLVPVVQASQPLGGHSGDLATAAETGNSFALLTITLLQPSAFLHIPRVRAGSLQTSVGRGRK